MTDFVRELARLRKELQKQGLDMTGEGAPVPTGFLRIPDEMAEIYREACHKVVRTTLVIKGKETEATLVSLGDPQKVAAAVKTREFFPKG